MQVNPTNHYLQWGIYMYLYAANYGDWVVDVYVNGVRVDQKIQDYPPHASLPPSIAVSGGGFYITATDTFNNIVYYSVPNYCVIP